MSGHCVDAVCCDSACSGVCERCDLSPGSCTILSAGSAADASCFPFATCDGTSGDCPLACVSDAACAADHYCSSAGECAPRKPPGQPCNPAEDCAEPSCELCQDGALCADGVCCELGDASSCLPQGSKCSSGEPCASGLCVDGVCCNTSCDEDCSACTAQLKGAGEDGVCGVTLSCAPGICDVDGHTLLTMEGLVKEDCAPYRCSEQGECVTLCASTADCLASHRCSSSRQCVARSELDGSQSVDGACNVAHGSRHPTTLAWWLLALSALSCRRRETGALEVQPMNPG